MREITRLALLTFTFVSIPLVTASGCSGAPFTSESGAPPIDLERTGSAGFELEVGAGVTLHGVSYVINGNGFTKEGVVDISQSPILTAVIGGIPAGDGFTITITATSIDGSVTCVGTATFAVMEGLITKVTIHLQCRFGHRVGKIGLHADVNLCPAIEEVTATPMETGMGSTITLFTRLADSDGPASALDMILADGLTSLSLHGRDTAAIELTCVEPGPSRITVTASDGECLQGTAVDVTCSGSGTGPRAVWTWKQLDVLP